MTDRITRREMIACTGIVVGTGAATLPGAASRIQAAQEDRPGEPFRYCLNTATIRGQKLDVSREVKMLSITISLLATKEDRATTLAAFTVPRFWAISKTGTIK